MIKFTMKLHQLMIIKLVSIGLFSTHLVAMQNDLPKIFGTTWEHLTYYHAPSASLEELQLAKEYHPIFEIDFSFAITSFHPTITVLQSYIGHPEEFYTMMHKPFPDKNVSLNDFQAFLLENPEIKVLIDLKDLGAIYDMEKFIQAVGPERCIVHAFIKDWTVLPEGVVPEPHWHVEDIDLFSLDVILKDLKVPLIANCRGFSDQHVQKHQLIERMLTDAKKYGSIVSLGLYYPGAPIPANEYLQTIESAGFYPWVNGNKIVAGETVPITHSIAMCDSIEHCTRFRDR